LTCRAPGCYQFFCLLEGDLQATLLFPSFASPAARGEQLWGPKDFFRRVGLISWRRLLLGLATAIVVMNAGCGSSGPPNATPIITSLYPDYVYAGGCGFTMSISGTGFISTSTVYWNNALLSNAVYDSTTTEMVVPIPASLVANVGIAEITVANPPPGGGTSQTAATLEIKKLPLNTVPSTITCLNPSSVVAGSGALSLSVGGVNFPPDSVVDWNGSPRTTTFTSATQLTAQILATDVKTDGTAQVTVSASGGVSPYSVFTITAPPTSSQATPQFVSVNADGGPADGQGYGPAIGADGRYAAFYFRSKSRISDRVSGDIFVRDTCRNIANCTPQTIAVDITPDGGPPNGPAGIVLAISSTGRFVAFSSEATNLVNGGEVSNRVGMSNIFVRDLCLGYGLPDDCTPRTELVSVAEGGKLENGYSYAPSLSADGRFVAFESWATNLVPGLSRSAPRAYVTDLSTHQTLLVSTASQGAADDFAGKEPSISGDGRYVAFTGWSLDSRHDANQPRTQVFLRDTCLGSNARPACVPSLTTASASPDGAEGDNRSQRPFINGDGRFVVFRSHAGNLAHDASGEISQILLRDTCLGTTAPSGCQPATTIVSVDIEGGAGNGDSDDPFITQSGRYVSFISKSKNLSTDSSYRSHVYVRDTCLGVVDSPCVPHTRHVSFLPKEAIAEDSTMSRAPLTDDGGFIAFFSYAGKLATPVSEDGDVFIVTVPH